MSDLENTPIGGEQDQPTATEVVENNQPEIIQDSGSDDQEKPVKTFTQEEVNQIVKERLARERRKKEQSHEVQVPEVKTINDYDSPEEYAEALANKKAFELAKTLEQKRQLETLVESYEDRAKKAREKFNDFDQVVDGSLRITDVMATEIMQSPLGPEIAYYLGTNREESERIADLPYNLQIKELGKLENKLETVPLAKKVTKAPSPINPVTPRNITADVSNLSDPKSLQQLGTSEWIERRIKERRNNSR